MTLSDLSSPASIDLDAFDVVAGYQVEAINRAKIPGAVRIWSADVLLAVTCTSADHVGERLVDASALIAHRGMAGGRSLCCVTCDRVRASRAMSDGRHAESVRRSRARLSARTPEQIAADRERLRPDGLKVCRKCREALPLERFSVNRNRPDGLNNECRPCAHSDLWNAALPGAVDGDTYDRCVYTGLPADDIDHAVPVSLGGTDAPGNLVPASWHANRGPGGKHATPQIEWLLSLPEEPQDDPHLPWLHPNVKDRLRAAVADVLGV